MRHTNSFIDVAHPLGSIGVLLLLTVVHLAGPALTTHSTTVGRVGGFAARRALDVVSLIGWMFDRLPPRGTAAVRNAQAGHRAAAASRTATTVWM